MEPEGSLPHSQMPSTCPYPEPARSSPLPHIPLPEDPLILSSHLRLAHPSGLFISDFPTKILYAPLLSPIRATCSTHLILLDLITRTIYGEQYRSSGSSICSFLHSACNLIPLRPKYSPQHPILNHPEPTFLPEYERPSFTPTQSNRYNYSSVYRNL